MQDTGLLGRKMKKTPMRILGCRLQRQGRAREAPRKIPQTTAWPILSSRPSTKLMQENNANELPVTPLEF
jgi:hypothetical protein